jgi:hypothetical protein
MRSFHDGCILPLPAKEDACHHQQMDRYCADCSDPWIVYSFCLAAQHIKEQHHYNTREQLGNHCLALDHQNYAQCYVRGDYKANYNIHYCLHSLCSNSVWQGAQDQLLLPSCSNISQTLVNNSVQHWAMAKTKGKLLWFQWVGGCNGRLHQQQSQIIGSRLLIISRKPVWEGRVLYLACYMVQCYFWYRQKQVGDLPLR